MRTIHKLPVVLSIMSISLLAQTPAPTSVQNPASNILAGFPNAGIAQGSIFVVYGKNLGPVTLAQAQSLPLPTTAGVGGTSVTITVGGTTATAPMIYSLATQIVGVLPSTVPVGTGTLTVAFNGQSGSIAIQVVATNFGISTVNETGAGPAVVTFANYNLVTTTNSAMPSSTLILWGTGLGPITGSDAVVPNEVDFGTPIKVFVGGVAATVTYRGRSGDPGLDQIVFVVPPGVSGCYVSLVVQTNNTVSNGTTMSISPNGGLCSDTDAVPLSSLSGALANKGSLNIGGVGLNQASYSSGGTTAIAASFNRYTAAQLATSPSLFGIPSTGSCLEVPFYGTNTPVIGVTQALGLNAGQAITVATPSGAIVNLTESNGVTGSYTSAPGALASLPAGNYTIDGKGGADVGAFSTSLNVLQPVTWANEAAITTPPGGLPGVVNRAQGVTVTWSGGDPNGFAAITGLSLAGTSSSSPSGYFYCIAPVAPGQFTVSPSVLLALPPTSASGAGLLFVGSSSAPQMFTVPGLDFAYAVATRSSGASLVYQ